MFAPKSRIMLIEYTYVGKDIVFSKYFCLYRISIRRKEIVFSKYFCLYRISIRRKEIVFSQRTCFKTHSNQLEMQSAICFTVLGVTDVKDTSRSSTNLKNDQSENSQVEEQIRLRTNSTPFPSTKWPIKSENKDVLIIFGIQVDFLLFYLPFDYVHLTP